MKTLSLIFTLLLFFASNAQTATTNEQKYKTGDALLVKINGTIKSTGGCSSPPMFGLLIKKDTIWENMIEMPRVQMDCGMPYIDCNDNLLLLFTIGMKRFELESGEYKILLKSKTGEVIESNVFQVTKTL